MRLTGAPQFRDTVEAAAERARHLCLETYGCAPAVRVAGDTAAHLPYVWGHLDYILFELLKNSLRAVVERQSRDGSGGAGVAAGDLEPVTVRICQAPEAITIQVSDRGGGLLPDVREAVWQYGFSTIDRGSGGGGASGVPSTTAPVCWFSRVAPLLVRQGADLGSGGAWSSVHAYRHAQYWRRGASRRGDATGAILIEHPGTCICGRCSRMRRTGQAPHLAAGMCMQGQACSPCRLWGRRAAPRAAARWRASGSACRWRASLRATSAVS